MPSTPHPYRSVFRPGLFAGQVVWVTGGGSGIGRCTAHELASLGATVLISGRAELQLFAFDEGSGIDVSRVLRVQLRLGDRLGWLASSPELELRAVSADLTLPPSWPPI